MVSRLPAAGCDLEAIDVNQRINAAKTIRRVISNPDDITRYQVEFYNLAKSIKGAMGRGDVNVDWGDKVLALRVEVDQEQARALGVTSAGVSRSLAGAVSGVPIGQYRENDRLVEVMRRHHRIAN